MPEPCGDPTTLIVGASLAAVVVVLIFVVVVVVTCSCYRIHNRKECRKDNAQEMTDFAHQMSIEQVAETLDCFREQLNKEENPKVRSDLIIKITQLNSELIRPSSVRTDGDDEENEEVDEQVLILLQDILKRGKQHRKLMPDMLKTIMEEVGSEIKEFE